MAAVLPLGLEKIEDEYVLFGVAALICLATFGGLILKPALDSYGRIWEKAAAAVLSLFVFAALVVLGVVLGLAIVINYNTIVEFINGN
jgi:hypothetical protein